MDALWAVVSFPSRLAGCLLKARSATLCLLSLDRDAALWLRVIAAAVEERLPGHLASTVDYPEPERDPHEDAF